MKQKVYILLLISNFVVTNCYSQNAQCGNPNLPGSSAASAAGSSGDYTPPDCNPDDGDQNDGGDDNNWDFIIYGIGSWDPNLIVTSLGVGKPKWVSVHDKIGATIYFENDPNLATAPVHNAYIYYKFPAKQDPISFRLGNFGFNGWVFTVPQDRNTYQVRLDLRDSLGLYVDVTAGINVIDNTAFWIFQSIDPLTNLPPADPLKGFLPIKDTSLAATLNDSVQPKGEGFVSFTAAPYATAKTRDSIYAQAKIVFDINDTIPTNIDFNTVDAVAPISKIYMSTVSNNTISLFWNGTDDPNGSGVKDYSVYVSENNAPFTFYKTVSGFSTDYTGNPGSVYCFYVMARDSVNNMEAPLKNLCEVRDSLSGGVLPVTWLYFRGKEQGNNVLLSWATGSEINTKNFIVERSLNGRDFNEIATVNAGVHNYQYLDRNALQLNSKKIFYRIRQVDKDGKFNYSNIISFDITKDEFVKVYPNPFTQSLILVINTPELAEVSDHLELFSISGTLLYRRTLSDRQNNLPIQLNDLPVLSSGTYILKTTLNGKINSVKIVKQ